MSLAGLRLWLLLLAVTALCPWVLWLLVYLPLEAVRVLSAAEEFPCGTKGQFSLTIFSRTFMLLFKVQVGRFHKIETDYTGSCGSRMINIDNRRTKSTSDGRSCFLLFPMMHMGSVMNS